MKRNRAALSKPQWVIFLVLCLFMGTVFTFGVQYWKAPIEKSEAIYAKATYTSHEVSGGRRRSDRILLYFSDYAQLDIEASCVNQTVKEKLARLPSDTEVELLIHPNTSMVLELQAEDEKILEFQETQEKLRIERNEFLILGLILYAGAVYAAVSLYHSRIQRI